MNKYDVFCIFDPKTEETKVEAVLKKVENKLETLGGKVLTVEKKGTFPLSFRLRKRKNLKEALYINLVIEAAPQIPAELTKLLKITEEIVRTMITLKKEDPPKAIKGEPAVTQEEKVEIAPAIFAEGSTPGGQS